MTSPSKIETQFWKALKSSPIMMVGLADEHDGYARPMTAQFKDAAGPIWFFASRKSGLVSSLTSPMRAMTHFVAKEHDLFASIHGVLQIETSDARVDEFWVDAMAIWYEGGKRDPNLVLLRLDPEDAKIWLSSFGIGMTIKLLLGGIKAVAKGQVAEVSLEPER